MRVTVLFFTALLFVTLFHTHTFAQFYAAGEDPGCVKWFQMEADNIRVVFPEGYQKQASGVLSELKLLRKKAKRTLPAKLPSISVLIHNQTALANGFVAWAPKRMELFALPDQSMYAQEWLKQLSIHEMRHVVQISSLRQGMTKVLSYLLGEQAIGAVLGLYIPTWFLEGDAVTFETAYTNVGRGRTPAFYMPYLAMLKEYGGFSYEKATLGSYKHFIPDRYVVGYHLVSFSRMYYSDKLWSTTLRNVAYRPYSITPFSRGIKKWTGYNKWKWYDWSARKIDSVYSTVIKCVHNPAVDYSTMEQSKDFISYRYPQYYNDSLVLVEKSGLSYVKQWVLLDRHGKEERLAYPGYNDLVNTSLVEGKLYYTEYRFDKRWTHRRWADVCVLDIYKKKKKKLSRKEYAYAPAKSATTNILVYVKQNKDNQYSLVLRDGDGVFVNEIISNNNAVLFTPAWLNDSTIVTIALDKDKGKFFTACNINTGQWEALSTPSYYDINQLVVWKGYLLHRAAYKNKEQIYAYHISSHRLYQVSREEYLASDPSVHKNQLLFSAYDANGYKVKTQLLDEKDFIPVVLKSNHFENVITKRISAQETGGLSSDSEVVALDTAVYDTKRYRKGANLINIHSWGPFYLDVDNANLYSGASLMSQNLLSTSFFTLGYLYNNTEEKGKWQLDYKYTGLYPIIQTSVSLGERYMKRYGAWKEFLWDVGVGLPFVLTHGPYNEKMTYSVSAKWQSIYDVQEGNLGGLTNRDLLSTTYQFDYYRLFKVSPRDLKPSTGQTLMLQYRNTPVNANEYTSVWSGIIGMYFPSLWKHHSIYTKLQGHYYDQGKSYYLSSPVTYPRGYSDVFSPQLLRASVDYSFPLCYPDWRLTSLFYIKRFKTNVFYDGAWTFTNTGKNTSYLDSKGVDLRMDFHFANFLAPIDMGIRIYQQSVSQMVYYQFLLGYSL